MSRRLHIILHGTVRRPCGFSLINRRLVPGLRGLGHRVSVLPNDAPVARLPPPRVPDVYLFHGDPQDFAHAPGRRNVYFLQWEYRRVPRAWVQQLNRRFDAVVVPSRFAQQVCAASGVRRPVYVCPGAVDSRAFHPGVPPQRLPTRKRFRFLYLGGAHERRGIDVLLRAYLAEFSADDDVALVIKGFHYDHHRPWLDHTMQRLGVGRPGAAEVVYTHGTEASVAGYFTAADVGVFPVRAECLGLPVLECLASGRPVIVTGGTGLDEFCTPANARFIRATPHVRRRRAGVEPDVAHLRALLREAFVRGSAAPQERERIRRSVAAFTWERSVARLSAALVPPAAEASARRTPPRREADIPSRTTDAGLELTNRERTACGLEPITLRPIDRWQAVMSGAAARAAGVAASHVQIRRVPYPCRPTAPRPARGPMRALFVAREPFAAGIRPLLEAWDRVHPRHAELVCAIDKAALRSPRLLRVLVRNPAITIRGTASPRTLGRLCAESDLVVQPSVAAATEVTLTALGRGRPVLIAAGAGGSELITHRRDGYVCTATSVAALRRGLVFCLADRRRLGSMARAAAATARRLHAHRTAE